MVVHNRSLTHKIKKNRSEADYNLYEKKVLDCDMHRVPLCFNCPNIYQHPLASTIPFPTHFLCKKNILTKKFQRRFCDMPLASIITFWLEILLLFCIYWSKSWHFTDIFCGATQFATQLWVKRSTVFSFMLLSHTAFIFLNILEYTHINGYFLPLLEF